MEKSTDRTQRILDSMIELRIKYPDWTIEQLFFSAEYLDVIIYGTGKQEDMPKGIINYSK